MPETSEKSGSMMGTIQEKIDNFKNLDQNQKTIILAAFALVISTLVVITFWFNRTEYKVLYNDLSDKDAAQVTKLLKEKKVLFKLQDQGKTILVPENSVQQIRLDMAGEGLPKSGTMGFEIFDKTDFQSSEFVEGVKYVRALQGELSTTINTLEAVEESRINLSIPRRRIYMNEDEKPTASVVLKLRYGYNLNNEEVRGIAFLVGSCVEGLKPENVTIMSTDGNLLSEFMQDGALSASSNQIRIQKEMQKNLELKVSALLTQILGEGKAVVKAHVDLKQDQKEIKKEIYQPATGNVGVVRSSQTLQEDYEEKGKQVGTADQGGATPAASPSVSPTPSSANVPGVASTGSGQPVYGQKSLITNYEISKIIENERVYPGEIKKISLGVVIDAKAGIKDEQLNSIKDVIASSAGIDKARGDLLTVRVIGFHKKPLEQAEEKAETFLDLAKKYDKYLIPLMAPVMVLIFASMMFRKKKEIKGKPDLGTGKTAPMGTQIPPMMGASTLNVVSDEPTDILGGGHNFMDSKDAEFKEDIHRFARENPKAAAKMIEQWIHEG